MIKKITIVSFTLIALFSLNTALGRIDPGGGSSFGNATVNTFSTCTNDQIDSVILGCVNKTSSSFDSNLIVQYVNTIFGWGVSIIGSVAMLSLIYAGYKYITSAGNPDSIKLAKEIVVTAITSIVLVVFSWGLFKLLGLVQ